MQARIKKRIEILERKNRETRDKIDGRHELSGCGDRCLCSWWMAEIRANDILIEYWTITLKDIERGEVSGIYITTKERERFKAAKEEAYKNRYRRDQTKQ